MHAFIVSFLEARLRQRTPAISCIIQARFERRLMRLFEGGILSKITEEEYQKLNDKLMGSEKDDETTVVIEPVLEGSEPQQDDDEKQLTIAMSMKTLQGAFYVLAIGSILAGGYGRWSQILVSRTDQIEPISFWNPNGTSRTCFFSFQKYIWKKKW